MSEEYKFTDKDMEYIREQEKMNLPPRHSTTDIGIIYEQVMMPEVPIYKTSTSKEKAIDLNGRTSHQQITPKHGLKQSGKSLVSSQGALSADKYTKYTSSRDNMVHLLSERVDEMARVLTRNKKGYEAVAQSLLNSAERLYAVQVACHHLMSGNIGNLDTDSLKFKVTALVGSPEWASSLETYIQEATNNVIRILQQTSARRVVEAEQAQSLDDRMNKMTENFDGLSTINVTSPKFSALDAKIYDSLQKTYARVSREASMDD